MTAFGQFLLFDVPKGATGQCPLLK